jgi:hypothetical protein
MSGLPVFPFNAARNTVLRTHARPAASVAVLTIAALTLAACGSSAKPVEQSAAAPAAEASAPLPEKVEAKACDMVPQAEMSAILGSAVVAAADDRSSRKTKCVYTAASGISPYVEFSVDWGGGEASMTAMGMLGKKEKGINNPYDGIGDQAFSIGPTLMIRSGEDLVTLVFSGVDDAPATAKKIFDTAKARM